MKEDSNNFETRLLYSQESYVDENIKVKSNVCAISYSYSGAITPVTVRCRLTIVYSDDADVLIDVKGGTIERWTDRGWLTVDEFFDAFVGFESADEGLDYMLSMFKSFMLGAPINAKPISNPTPSVPPTMPDKKPNIRVLSFAKEKAKAVEADKTKPKNTGDEDTPDFDWI